MKMPSIRFEHPVAFALAVYSGRDDHVLEGHCCALFDQPADQIADIIAIARRSARNLSALASCCSWLASTCGRPPQVRRAATEQAMTSWTSSFRHCAVWRFPVLFEPSTSTSWAARPLTRPMSTFVVPPRLQAEEAREGAPAFRPRLPFDAERILS